MNDVLQLNNGIDIPVLGLGTWLIDNDVVDRSVMDALELGYRHVDTAQAYGNEEGVGNGCRASGLRREDVFVVSKVAAEHKTYESAAAGIDETLLKMNLDYLDMMIIHSPQPWADVNIEEDRYKEGNVAAYTALEDAVKAGKLRALGVSNFLVDDIQNIIDHCSLVPAVNQVLCHVGNTPFELIEYCKKNDIQVEAYSPVAHGEILNHQPVVDMAKKYGVSVARLCIRYCVQLGLIVLPKSASRDHIQENAQLNFDISSDDMEFLKGIRFADYGDASFFPVYGGKLR
ncbi:MAG: aldo/keto reductase [Actinomycetaceae bacterium]|nr:aldo/keto reductase [Actinomycetaceae bacterium]